jgi:hypothetical protein
VVVGLAALAAYGMYLTMNGLNVPGFGQLLNNLFCGIIQA